MTSSSFSIRNPDGGLVGFAATFPGTICIVGGRAFRRLAELSGASPRQVAAWLPDRSWNWEAD